MKVNEELHSCVICFNFVFRLEFQHGLCNYRTAEHQAPFFWRREMSQKIEKFAFSLSSKLDFSGTLV